jgi:hypothetical protein
MDIAGGLCLYLKGNIFGGHLLLHEDFDIRTEITDM